MRLARIACAAGTALALTWASNASADGPLTHGSVDEAAVSCLDWAWSQQTVLEMAGGIVRTGQNSYTCSYLTTGTRYLVAYAMYFNWVGHFHTHTARGGPSLVDRQSARDDILSRPSYVREPDGTVWAHQCLYPERRGKVTRRCRTRKVRSSSEAGGR